MIQGFLSRRRESAGERGRHLENSLPELLDLICGKTMSLVNRKLGSCIQSSETYSSGGGLCEVITLHNLRTPNRHAWYSLQSTGKTHAPTDAGAQIAKRERLAQADAATNQADGLAAAWHLSRRRLW